MPYTKNLEMKIFSYSSINSLVVRNPFQKDYDHMGRIPHYKYWSPKQEPDPTEIFVGVLTQNIRKPVYYHNLYYKPDMVFVEDKPQFTTTNNQENPNFKITYNHRKSLENRGILEKIMNLKNTKVPQQVRTLPKISLVRILITRKILRMYVGKKI